jgi:Pectate lyase superfamily protein
VKHAFDRSRQNICTQAKVSWLEQQPAAALVGVAASSECHKWAARFRLVVEIVGTWSSHCGRFWNCRTTTEFLVVKMRAYLLFLVSLLRDCGSKRTASIPTPPAVPMIPNRSVNVVAYGAVPNDGKDDTQAIQNAIDDLQSKGGGSVMFPAGRYDISIQPTSTICSPSNTSANCRPHPLALVLYSKLRLASADATNRATLRLADNQGNYEAIMATAEYWFPLEDFVLENVIIDANGPNNPVRRPAGSDACCENSPDFGIGYNQTQRYALRVYIGARLLVDNVRFLASVNTNVVAFNGEDVTDGEIKNSRFESVGQDLVDFDHSSIYTSGKRFRIIDNTFTSKNGPGTLGARTAIEIHGDDQLVKNNQISGFTLA